MGEWDSTIQEWLVDEGQCFAAGMAQEADGAFYAAAPTADDAGWGFIYSDPHEQQITKEDGDGTEPVQINEAAALLSVATTGSAPKGGLWLAKVKYTVTQRDMAMESGDYTMKYAFGTKAKGGVHIVKTTNQIVCGFYSEEKGQNAGNSKKSSLGLRRVPHEHRLLSDHFTTKPAMRFNIGLH